jgi:hypothetical protein
MKHFLLIAGSLYALQQLAQIPNLNLAGHFPLSQEGACHLGS